MELLDEVEDLELNREGMEGLLEGDMEAESARSALFDLRENGFGRMLGFVLFDLSLESFSLLVFDLELLLSLGVGSLVGSFELGFCVSSDLEEFSGDWPSTERLIGEIPSSETWHTVEVALGVEEYKGLGSTGGGILRTSSLSLEAVFSVIDGSIKLAIFGLDAPSGLLK